MPLTGHRSDGDVEVVRHKNELLAGLNVFEEICGATEKSLTMPQRGLGEERAPGGEPPPRRALGAGQAAVRCTWTSVWGNGMEIPCLSNSSFTFSVRLKSTGQ